MIFETSLIEHYLSEFYPYAEISWYWSESTCLGVLVQSAAALSNLEHTVISTNSGGRTVIFSLHFGDSRPSSVARLIQGEQKNKVFFDTREYVFTDCSSFVSGFLSLIDSVI